MTTRKKETTQKATAKKAAPKHIGLVQNDGYLEPFEELCHTGAVYECVLVCRQGNNRTGILVIPDSGGFIKCAARYEVMGRESK